MSLNKTLFIGKNIISLASCNSTNEEVVRYLEKDNLIDGTIVITANQVAGKGQRGNTWESQSGANLTFSIFLKPVFVPIINQFNLNVAVSLGIMDFLLTFDDAFQIKWPNDIYHKDKKVCGILIQNFIKKNQLSASIVGIGLNINQQIFEVAQASSLSMITEKEYQLEGCLEDLCKRIESRYLELKASGAQNQRQQYLNNLYWFGQDHIFSDGKPFSGRIVGISSEGKLEIETNRGLRHFSMKEVVFID